MGEIVRVLKWRLDLDSAGLADGIEKAATSAEKLAKSTAEIGTKAAPGLKATAAAAKETETAFEGLGYETQQVLRYVQSLEKGAGSPLVLKRNAEQAEAAFNVLSTAAGKAGTTISDAFSDRVITAISKGTTQAAAMNAELEKMGGQTPTKLDKVITALDKTAQSSGAATAALKATTAQAAALGAAAESTAKSKEKLGDSVRRSTESVNKMRGAAMELVGVFWLGVTAGNALSAVIQKQSEVMARTDKKLADAAVNTIKFQQAMKLAEQGLISIGGPQEQFLARYDAYIAKTNPAIRATEAQTKALKDQQKAMEDLGASMAYASKAVSFTINTPKAEDIFPLEEATKYASRLADILGKAFKEGGATERNAWASANQETIEKVIASYAKFGLEVPAIVKDAYASMAVESAGGLGAMREAAEGSYDSLQRFRQEVMDQMPASQATAIAMRDYAGAIAEVAAATAEYEAQRQAANEADRAAVETLTALRDNAGQTARSIDTIGEAWARATGQAAGFTVEVRHATQAVKETTPEFDAFIESLAVTSDEFERMTPYVGSLIAQLESGQINTDQFRQAIEGLQVGFMQIQGVSGQMFGDLDSLWAKLNALLNEFTRKGK